MVRLWLLKLLAVARAAWRSLTGPDDHPGRGGAPNRSR